MKIGKYREKYAWAHTMLREAFPDANIMDDVLEFGVGYVIAVLIGDDPNRVRYTIELEFPVGRKHFEASPEYLAKEIDRLSESLKTVHWV